MAEAVVNPNSTQVPAGQDSPQVDAGGQPQAVVAPEVSFKSEPPTPDKDSSGELAAAEKRVADTQRWGHALAQENARLKSDLNAIFNHPVFGQALQQGLGDQGQPGVNVDDDVKQAWREYQTSANDEEAFSKILKFAEERATRKSLETWQEVMAQREQVARIQQRNVFAAQTINEAVSAGAPDVPLELFWAMSQRAELETPQEIQGHTNRLAWQVGRAIELSRSVLNPVRQDGRRAVEQSLAANRAAGAIMGAGQSAGGSVGGQEAPKNFVEQIRAMQRERGTRP